MRLGKQRLLLLFVEWDSVLSVVDVTCDSEFSSKYSEDILRRQAAREQQCTPVGG